MDDLAGVINGDIINARNREIAVLKDKLDDQAVLKRELLR